MRLNLTIAVIAISFLNFAQNYSPEMRVLRSDLLLNSYDRDSTANALIIYDYGNSFFDSNTFALRVQVKQKIKILRKEGLDKGEVEIKLYKGKSSEEKIRDIKGATYNLENGTMIKTELKPSAIFKEDNEKFTTVKFVLPNIRVGSVITYSYETQSRFIHNFQPWYFQGEDPVLYSEYNTKIPGNYEYNIKLVGELSLDTHDTSLEKNCIQLRGGASADCSIAKYVMKNIPAYKPEAFTTTPSNYIARIDYELSVVRGFDGSVDKITKTWASVDNELKTDADFGRQVNKKNLVKKVLPNEVTSIENKLEKAKAIYQYVVDNYKWDGKFERYNVAVKNTVKEKIGNAFEINLLLENLLSLEGFKVYPILISTRANGLATKIYPVLTDFNYLILKTTIDNEDYYLDATDPYLSFGELPFRSLNQYGRLIDFEDGSYWEAIEIKPYSVRTHRIEIDAFESEMLQGTLESTFSGYHSHGEKRRFDENPVAYKSKKAEKYADMEINDHDIIDFSKSNYDFKERMTIAIEPEYIGDKLYLNPFLITFFEDNPFKLQDRTYPIDFGYKDVYNYVMSIDLKDTFEILEIPDSINYSLPNKSGQFFFNIENKDNKLTLYFKVIFNKAIYGPQYYESLKQFMKKVVETQKNTVIVLKNN